MFKSTIMFRAHLQLSDNKLLIVGVLTQNICTNKANDNYTIQSVSSHYKTAVSSYYTHSGLDAQYTSFILLANILAFEKAYAQTIAIMIGRFAGLTCITSNLQHYYGAVY